MPDSKRTSFFRNWFASGEPWIWMNAAAVGISLSAVIGILLLIAVKGLSHFWPADVAQITFTDQNNQLQSIYGELIELDVVPVKQFLESGGNPEWTKQGEAEMRRWLVKTGNRKVNPPDFRWIYLNQIKNIESPSDIIVLERVEWGNAYGVASSINTRGGNNAQFVTASNLSTQLKERLERGSRIRDEIHELERGEMNRINQDLEKIRLKLRQLNSEDFKEEESIAETLALQTQLLARYDLLEKILRGKYEELDQDELTILDASGREINLRLADVLRIWRPNSMNGFEKLIEYVGNLGRFLSEDPREANTEGGVFPAIFGTVLMVLLMSVVVTPFGVIAAVYLTGVRKTGTASKSHPDCS